MGLTEILRGTASLAFLAVAVFLGYLVFAVLPRLRQAIGQIQTLLDKDVQQLLTQADEALKQVNVMMPKVDSTIAHLNEITANVESLSEERIDPIAADIQDITHKIQQDITKIDQTVTVATEFSQETIKQASFYREKLFEPVVEIASLWSGLKAGVNAFRQSTRSRKK